MLCFSWKQICNVINCIFSSRLVSLLRFKCIIPSAIIQNGLFQLNRQLLGNGEKDRKLSYRETELLKVLYENRDKIIDRKDILNLLWGNDNFFNSRNLDVYITKLRGYLKEDTSVEIITIKGIGYRFVTTWEDINSLLKDFALRFLIQAGIFLL